jgi:hypothetical protein
MKPLLVTVAICIGVPVTLLVGILIVFFANIPIPMGSDQFHNDWKFGSLVTQGNQMIGGGYSFSDGRDIWIRIRLNHEPSSDLSPGGETCSPEELEKIRTWFLERTAPQKILGILPVSADSPDDVMALNDVANLRCSSAESHNPILHKFGEFPKGCSPSWVLYHRPSHFYYERSPCSH